MAVKITTSGKATYAIVKGQKVRVGTGKSVKAGPRRPDEVLKPNTKGAPVCKKDATHGEKRITPRGTMYCLICDREQAERERQARRAAKEAAEA